MMIQVQLKLRPTKAQERTFVRWLWHLTAVWNWSIKTLENSPARLSCYELKAKVTGHSARMGISAYAIGGTIATAYDAHRRYRSGLAGKPKLKGQRRQLSSIAFSHWQAKRSQRTMGKRAYVPGIGQVRFHEQDIPEGRIGQARIVRRASGWYLCLFIQADAKPVQVIADRQVGIDPGFSSLLTLSTGERIDHPRELEREAQRLGQAQRGGRKALAARLQERIRSRRHNRNHHLSRRLVSENALVAFSADHHGKMARRFGKSVTSSAHYELRRQLAHKSLIGGREYIEVSSRNTTRACSSCSALTGPKGLRELSVRAWECSACGAHHDRDVNAAMNVLRLGLGISHERRREAATGIAS